MKKKKFFKKLLALMLALVLSNVGATVEQAEAATCPPHGEYYDTVMYERDLSGAHNVKKRVYGTDDFGNLVEITDSLANPIYVTCIVSMQEQYIIVRCKKCYLQIYSYCSRTPEIHSYCPVK